MAHLCGPPSAAAVSPVDQVTAAADGQRVGLGLLLGMTQALIFWTSASDTSKFA
jgi:hypothetical protein